MPALQRRHNSPNLRQAKATEALLDVHPMVKSTSQSSEENLDLSDPKQLAVQASQLPARYESDEESASPLPEDFEDAGLTFSDVEIDSSLDLEMDELPSIVEVRQIPLIKAPSKPLLVNISKLAPMEKRATPAHVRPSNQNPPGTIKTSIGRTVVVQSNNDGSFKPSTVALQRPPPRFRAPPPVPPRSQARVMSPAPMTPASPVSPMTPQQATPTQAMHQGPAFPPRKSSHAPRPSVSTISTQASAYDTDDDSSSTAGDSTASSAPSSVADDSDLQARSADATMMGKSPIEDRKDSTAIRDHQDVELERAISDYMLWRSEGSPGEPPETVYKLSHEDKQMVRDQEEEEWRRELEMGLATPTPTSYAAYDPFGMNPPMLARPKAPFQGGSSQQQQHQHHQEDTGRLKGLRKGFGIVRRAV